MQPMVNSMDLKPKYVYIIQKKDLKPIARHIRKNHPNSEVNLMRTIDSFLESD